MFYLLLYPLKDLHPFFNIFRYITFRTAGASVTAFLVCLIFGPWVIRMLKQMQALAHTEREHAQAIHAFYAHKKQVPTMGGLLIVASLILSIFLWGNWTVHYVWIVAGITIWFGVVGFLDDWIKLKSKSSRGLSSFTKFAGQLVAGIALGLYLYMDPSFDKMVHFPFFKDLMIYIGALFIPFVVLVLVGTSNALNLTDGLDGLAIGCLLFVAGAFAMISYVVGRVDHAAYLQIAYVAGAGELAVFCAALMGASAGFLWYNAYPAEVMMGDTGSLSLGGALGAIAILTKKELVLVIAGGVFVWEALSVILQVVSFKFRKKRIFLMSPFHHHLQLKGWPESKVTIRLWIISFILALVGLSTLKLR
ncbi:MAG: phospho-N-acetylmuramoyl-pentapeptide-transferase [Candidatus Omnitrophica bacterium]|nr:phospho-N-acetylmuramoyl-pentapeptide-transferase [Candidatus Omnitrophota bacterium]